jgi:hypothetical protein
MKTEKIIDNGSTIAIIIRDSDWTEGLNFLSSEGDFLQVGTWYYQKEKKLEPHIHLNAPREAAYTQEVVYVKEGRMNADIYNEKEELIRSVDLAKGDALILLKGGHGYEILEDNTKILEIKNGPYAGADKDRKRIKR